MLFTDPQAQMAMTPLAERMRPTTLSEVAGQVDVVSVLRDLIQKTALPSLILWGPPGCGKTTIARLLAGERYHFDAMSAVSVGVKEVRAVMEEARQRRITENLGTLMFLDEIHRFNKAQQDALLPHVEAGTIVLVGATTENPSFEVNSALLSRCRVLVLTALEDSDIESLLQRALTDNVRGLGMAEDSVEGDVLTQIAQLASGDARFALNTLEVCASIVGATPVSPDNGVAAASPPLDSGEAGLAPTGKGRSMASPLQEKITTEILKRTLAGRSLHYDKGGDEHFNAISALHKAVRGSDPDAALYWTARMLEGGEDPKYVVRRFIRMASEDIGLADPWALVHATATKSAVEFLGMPECNNALAQLAVYLACAPKSNAVYEAYKNTQKVVQQHGALPAPLNIRNAPTTLMKDLGYGENYTYAHNYPGGFTPDNYWPEKLAKNPPRLLHLKGLGAEKTLADRLRHWWGDRFGTEGLRPGTGVVPKEEPPATGTTTISETSTAAVPESGTTSLRGRRPNEIPSGTTAVPGRRPQENLLISQKKLPNWRLDGSAYFITWRLKKKLSDLSDDECTLVQTAIRFGKDKKYELYAYVVMNDHAHAVIRPLENEDIPSIVHMWKSFTTNQMQRKFGRNGQIWDTEYFDRIIRDEDELVEKCQYVLNNPQKRWPDVQDYKWAGWE